MAKLKKNTRKNLNKIRNKGKVTINAKWLMKPRPAQNFNPGDNLESI